MGPDRKRLHVLETDSRKHSQHFPLHFSSPKLPAGGCDGGKHHFNRSLPLLFSDNSHSHRKLTEQYFALPLKGGEEVKLEAGIGVRQRQMGEEGEEGVY